MRICEACGKKVYGGKHREVLLDGKRFIICGDCGRMEFTTAGGERGEGLLQSINMPRRKAQKGRNITFHAEKTLKAGDQFDETSFRNLPRKTQTLPARYRVLASRPLVVTEVVAAEGEGEEGKAKKERRRRRTVGYSIRACSC